MQPVTLSDLTIRDGNSTGPNAVGGGIASESAEPDTAWGDDHRQHGRRLGCPGVAGGDAVGGGIALLGGRLTLDTSTVSGNRAAAVGGSGKAGGQAVAAGIYGFGEVSIVNSTISGNSR